MKLEAGKWYKVKTWDQMEREFGLNEVGAINCCSWFTKDMEQQLVSEQPNRMIQFERITGWGNGVWKFWLFSKDILMSVEDELREVSRRLKNDAKN